ncbi:hypothetical protein [Liquorilactobacillus capillatus]|uniref:Uncharacterized protein n=1 Tax=Liquorilactobacillus capillatus DSM 19910 TaxID=1423731 RepID=A0A0R1M304_9LACO|nr:hypothetical protein [Liquorilactobacillus capillatus]KRL02415.1 hypothetical protein FC81_GL000759 [Liquorilactobacillus capillatus DSM 19910]
MKIFWQLFWGYILSGLNLGITLLIINERGTDTQIPAGMDLLNMYFIFNSLVFFPAAYLIIVKYRRNRKRNAEMSNIQKAFKNNGESFATANFIPAYLYHGAAADSTAAIFLLYYLVFLIAPLVLLCWGIRILYRRCYFK